VQLYVQLTPVVGKIRLAGQSPRPPPTLGTGTKQLPIGAHCGILIFVVNHAVF
jgi:hypothetical protein